MHVLGFVILFFFNCALSTTVFVCRVNPVLLYVNVCDECVKKGGYKEDEKLREKWSFGNFLLVYIFREIKCRHGGSNDFVTKVPI